MNNNDFLNDNSPDNKYRATRNLNTEIENPEMNINSAIGVNIKDIPTGSDSNAEKINSYFNSNINTTEENFNTNFPQNNNTSYDASNVNITKNYNQNQNLFINETNNANSLNQENNNFNTSYNNNEKSLNDYDKKEQTSNYKPTLQEKKKPKSFQIPNELKVMIFIVFILLLFIIIVPYVFDFVKEIELILTR